MTDVMPEQLVDLDELTGGETTPANTTGLDAVDEQLIAQLAGRARAGGLQLAGEGGLLAQLTKRLVESALEQEVEDRPRRAEQQRSQLQEVDARLWCRSPDAVWADGDAPRVTDPGHVEHSPPAVCAVRLRSYERERAFEGVALQCAVGREVLPGHPDILLPRPKSLPPRCPGGVARR